MKKVFSVLLCVFSVLVFSSSALFSGSAYAVTSPITWDDVSEDVIALRDSYYKLWSESSNFSEFFKNASDIPVKWVTTLADGTAALSPFNGFLFSKTEEVHKVEYTGPSRKFKKMIDNGEITPEKPVISSDDLSLKIDEKNQDISPKSPNMFVNSYRNDTNYFYNYPTSSYNAYAVAVTLFQDPSKKSTLTDLYCVPFYRSEDGIYYFQEYQLHFYFVPVEDTESGFDIALRVDTYKYNADFGYVYDDSISGVIFQEHNGDVFQVRFLGTSYYSTSSPSFQLVSTPAAYNNKTNTSYRVPFGSLGKYYTPDKSESLDISYSSSSTTTVGSLGFSKSYQKNPNLNNDIGFFCSSEMISCHYSCDTSKIPSGQMVTINGDTIYNYTITNPETGDSSKFGDYITNNYTYITNNYGEGESGGSGSGASGNVTVGGSIDVGGSVGVDVTVSVPDININVNGNGSGAGESVSLPDTDLVENLPEAPSGFIDYTASLFSFLPAEILSLLLAGLAAAIFCRIWGR